MRDVPTSRTSTPIWVEVALVDAPAPATASVGEELPTLDAVDAPTPDVVIDGRRADALGSTLRASTNSSTAGAPVAAAGRSAVPDAATST